MKYISCMDQTPLGAWEVYGVIGFRRYNGHTKKDVILLYSSECREKGVDFVKESAAQYEIVETLEKRILTRFRVAVRVMR